MENLKCNCCNKQTSDLRFGTCFDCAEAESIIEDGFDMYLKNYKDKDKGGSIAMKKLRFLIQKGWKKVN